MIFSRLVFVLAAVLSIAIPGRAGNASGGTTQSDSCLTELWCTEKKGNPRPFPHRAGGEQESG